jgi:hypothetical protein
MPVKGMEHTITSGDANITAANGTAAIMSDIFTYKTPRHTAILLRPEDVLSAYLKDAGAEAAGTDTFELIVRDPNQLTTEVLTLGIYTTIKEFQDRNKTRKLGLAKLVKSDYFVVLRVKATTVLVVSTCYFQITCMRYAETL